MNVHNSAIKRYMTVMTDPCYGICRASFRDNKSDQYDQDTGEIIIQRTSFPYYNVKLS